MASILCTRVLSSGAHAAALENLTLDPAQKGKRSSSERIQLFQEKEGFSVAIPFAYGVSRGCERPSRQQFPPVRESLAFAGELRPAQVEVVDECISAMSRTGSVMLSAHTGFGKCLSPSTLVMSFDGGSVRADEVVVGSLLMGDDSSPRRVISLATGRERMVRIVSEAGESFECNVSHILSLAIDTEVSRENKRNGSELRYISALHGFRETSRMFADERGLEAFLDCSAESTCDISVATLLGLPRDVRRRLRLFKAGVGRFGGLEAVERRARYKDLEGRYGEVRDRTVGFPASVPDLKGILTLARSLGMDAVMGGSLLEAAPGTRSGEKTRLLVSPLRAPHYSFEVEDLGDGRYVGFEISPGDANRRFLLADFTVTHNTVCAMNIAARVGLPAFFATCRPMLCVQALRGALVHLPASRAQFLQPDARLTPSIEEGSTFLAANAMNIPKLMARFPDLERRAGLLIVDEAHLLLTETLAHALLSLRPRYVLAMSATPFRYDGLDSAVQLFFGRICVRRELVQPHDVRIVSTGFKPTPVYSEGGGLNWSQMLTDQALHGPRNSLIAGIVDANAERRFLVVCKRTAQVSAVTGRMHASSIPARLSIAKPEGYFRCYLQV